MNILTSEKPVEKRVWGAWATLGFGACVGIATVIAQLVVGMLFGIGILAIQFQNDQNFNPARSADYLKSIEGLIVSVGGVLTTAVSIGLIIAFIRLRNRATIAEYLGLRRLSKKTFLISLAVMAIFIALADGLTIALGKSIVNEAMADVYKTSVWPALLWVALALLAPASEETFFRGFLFAGFSQSRIGVIGTIIITTVVWTALHTQYGYYELAQVFSGGLLLGFVRYKTGSLWYSMLMHAFGNLVATTEIVLFMNGFIH